VAALKDVEKDQVARQCADIQRCHRSYLVNRRRVARAMGNAQGLTLHLDRGEIEVPVSRSFVASFR
jgi:DNA-binding LytR/AlgR family response regulator